MRRKRKIWEHFTSSTQYGSPDQRKKRKTESFSALTLPQNSSLETAKNSIFMASWTIQGPYSFVPSPRHGNWTAHRARRPPRRSGRAQERRWHPRRSARPRRAASRRGPPRRVFRTGPAPRPSALPPPPTAAPATPQTLAPLRPPRLPPPGHRASRSPRRQRPGRPVSWRGRWPGRGAARRGGKAKTTTWRKIGG